MVHGSARYSHLQVVMISNYHDQSAVGHPFMWSLAICPYFAVHILFTSLLFLPLQPPHWTISLYLVDIHPFICANNLLPVCHVSLLLFLVSYCTEALNVSSSFWFVFWVLFQNSSSLFTEVHLIMVNNCFVFCSVVQRGQECSNCEQTESIQWKMS